MMYTDNMKTAFRSLQHHCPKGFAIDLIDNDDFITLRVYPDQLARLYHDDQYRAVEYVFKVKHALEDLGAIVMIVRNKVDK